MKGSVSVITDTCTSLELIFCCRDFLPRGSGIVTRRPLVLQLFYAKQGFFLLSFCLNLFMDGVIGRAHAWSILHK